MSTRILIAFYSLTGHCSKLAQYVAEGAREINDSDVQLKRIPDFLPDSFFEDKPRLKAAKEAMAYIPEATVDDLLECDAIAFGSPVHFGSFASQWKQFIDQLSPVFIKGQMTHKPAALFVSAGMTHGGEEAALISMMIPLLNLGMLPVGVPYPIQYQGRKLDAGSPYGAIFVSGMDGTNDITEEDKVVARILGKRVAGLAKVIKVGSEQSPDCEFLKEHHA